MPRMNILNSVEREVFDIQAPQNDRLNQGPTWELRNSKRSFIYRKFAKSLWDFTYLCWANPKTRPVNTSRACIVRYTSDRRWS
jgi:hypothetical protein